MTILDAFLIVVGVVSTFLCALRWWRVAQREHYLAGSTTRFARRWWVDQPLNLVQLFVGAAGVGAAVVLAPVSLLTFLIVATGPRGLLVRGRSSKLAWTRRLKTVAALSTVLAGAPVLLAGIFDGVHAAVVAVAAVAWCVPLVVDLSLVVLAPVEARLGARFVKQAERRLRQIHPIVVGITGSYGKTSTKFYVAHLCAGRFHVVASPQSFNNQAGLSRTVNEQLLAGTEVLVAEMGTYGKGEIAAMCRWMPPKIAVMTAIGPVHLERFKTIDAIVTAKREITVSAEVVVMNVDDERLRALAVELESQGKKVLRCSGSRRDVPFAVIERDSSLELVIEGTSVGVAPLATGASVAASNVACAVAVAVTLGCESSEILARLDSLPTASHRLETTSASNGAVVLDDTFNSNPLGAQRALQRLCEVSTEHGRRVLVTPGMVELGPFQEAANVEFARSARLVATDVVIVGRTNRAALRRGLAACDDDDGATAAMPRVTEVQDREQAVSIVTRSFGPGDAVLYENDLPDHYP